MNETEIEYWIRKYDTSKEAMNKAQNTTFVFVLLNFVCMALSVLTGFACLIVGKVVGAHTVAFYALFAAFLSLCIVSFILFMAGQYMQRKLMLRTVSFRLLERNERVMEAMRERGRMYAERMLEYIKRISAKIEPICPNSVTEQVYHGEFEVKSAALSKLEEAVKHDRMFTGKMADGKVREDDYDKYD